MQLIDETTQAVDVTATPIHLGTGSRARPVDGFAWDPEVLRAYGEAVADDGAEGRMVMVFEATGGAGDHWESHPAGEEVLICVSGRMTVVRLVDGREESVELGPGEATINGRGVWHAVDVDEPARFVSITPGVGTEHRPR